MIFTFPGSAGMDSRLRRNDKAGIHLERYEKPKASIWTVEKKISQLFLFFIIVLVFVASIFRTFGCPLFGSVDMAQRLFVRLCFFGADFALQQDRHIGVEILTRFFPKKMHDIITLCSYLSIPGFLLIITTLVFG